MAQRVSKFNNLFIALVLIFFTTQFVISCTSSINQEKLSKDDFQKITVPNLLEIQVPKYMQRRGTNRFAKVEYIDEAKKLMVLVFSEEKDTIINYMLFDKMIKDKSDALSKFSELYTQTIAYQLSETKLGDYAPMKINKYSAIQNDITGTDPNNKYKAKMRITYIEGEKSFFIISTIADITTFNKYENTFNQIIHSFIEL